MDGGYNPEASPPLRQQPWRQSETQRTRTRAAGGTSPSPFGTPQTPSAGAFAAFGPYSPEFHTSPDQYSRPPLRAFESFDSDLRASASAPRNYPSHSRTSSRSALLSPESSFTFVEGPLSPDPYHPGYARPQGYIAAGRPEPKLVAWSRRFQAWWRPSWTMFLFLFLGIIGAVSHHAFYAGLHGREATDQLRMLRYGAVLSFLTKACLSGAVLLAFRQRVWATLRSKLFSVSGIDLLFAASEDATALFSLEIYRKAKLAMSLAVFIWLTPLVVILTSDTLTINMTSFTDTTTCPSVRTLNFTHEQDDQGYFRDPIKIMDLFELSASFWNTTSTNLSDPNWFDYYTAPSTPLLQVAQMAAYYKKPLGRDEAAAEVCGVGWNCTFVVNFTAPGYRCQELSDGVGTTPQDLGDAQSPVNSSMLIPEGDLSYYAAAWQGDYFNPQMEAWPGGIPKTAPPFPPHLGAFRTEPVIWVGYSERVDPSKPLPSNRSDPAWADAFHPKVFACENYQTAYAVRFTYLSAGGQSTEVLSRNFLAPVMNTTFLPHINATDGTLDNTTATPESGYVYPRDIHRYRLTAAYHSVGSVLRGFVAGYLNASSPGNPVTATEASQTKLIDQKTYLPVPDLMHVVQSFCEDIVLSMFSNPRFLVVSWATRPSVKSGTAVGGDDTRYPCVRERRVNTFYYHSGDLWTVYGIAIALGALGVGLGLMAIGDNGGVVRGVRFSDIVGATRGPGLDRLATTTGDGDSVRGTAKGLKLGYGLVPKSGAMGLANPGGGVYGWGRDDVLYGFGIEGEVRQEHEPRRSQVFLAKLSSRKGSPVL